MNTKRQKIVATIFLLVIMGGHLPYSGTSVLGDVNTMQDQHCEGPVQGNPYAPKGSLAQRMASERFQLLKYAADRLGALPLSTMVGDYSYTVLFPVGSSDRMYFDISEPYGMVAGVKGDYLIYCYQRKDGLDKLVYRISIESRDRRVARDEPAKAPKQYASFLAYVTEESTYVEGIRHTISYFLPAGTSQFARNDLAIKRDYVIYEYYPIVDALKVSPLSEPDEPTMYDLNSEDSKTGIQDPTEFYKKYGLPVTKEELARMHGPSPAARATPSDTITGSVPYTGTPGTQIK